MLELDLLINGDAENDYSDEVYSLYRQSLSKQDLSGFKPRKFATAEMKKKNYENYKKR